MQRTQNGHPLARAQAIATAPVPKLRTRKPTGLAPWPFVLLEGEEGTGKTWTALELSASDQVGMVYLLSFDESLADEYGAIPGADFELIEWDGTWPDMLGQVRAVWAEAERVRCAGGPPVVLVIDSLTAAWEALKAWVDERAKRSDANQAKLARDPGADIKAPTHLWNSATARHDALMELLCTFPGIVVATARGKTALVMDGDRPAVDKRGRAIQEHKIEVQKSVPYKVSAIVRYSSTEAPTLRKVRSVHHGVRPGVDEPKQVPDFSLEWFIFEYLGCNPIAHQVRQYVPTSTRQALGSDEHLDAVRAEAWEQAQRLGWTSGEFRGHFYRTMNVSSTDASAAELRAYMAAQAQAFAPDGLPASASSSAAPVVYPDGVRAMYPAADDRLDWDALLEESAGDVDAIRALYEVAKVAEPDNRDLRVQIERAGEAARVAAEVAALDERRAAEQAGQLVGAAA